MDIDKLKIEDKYISKYIVYLITTKRLSINTIKSYLSELNSFSCFFDYDTKNLTLIKIEDYIKYLSEFYDTSTINHNISAIKNYYKYLVDEDIIINSDILKIKNLKSKSKVRSSLTVDEIDKLLDIPLNKPSDYRNKAMLELLYASGIRVSELSNLSMENINLDENYLIIMTKGSKERFVPITTYSSNLVKEYIATYRDYFRKDKITDKVFLSSYGSAISRVSIFKIIKKRALECSIKKEISPHTIRHSYATHMLNNNTDIRILQELLGHSSISTTSIYLHTSYKELQEKYNKYHPRSN